ncbi:MAG: AMP-binding protein, partial [Chloroflexota bacterium]
MSVVRATEKVWLRSYDEGVPATLDYPSVPLHALLDETARRHPDAVATIFGGVVGGRLLDAKMTYGELSRLADRFAAGLQSLGVAKGDRVALMLPNCPQFVIAFYGALRAGAVIVPVNPLYTPPELRGQLADSGAETLVVLSRLYPVAREALAGTAVKRVVVTNIKEHFPPLLRWLFTVARERKEGHRVDLRGDERAVRFTDLLRRAERPRPVAVEPSDLAVLQYTGGTTGTPKGAMLSHRALVANVLQCRAWHRPEEGETGLAVMPFFHVYGLTCVMNFGIACAGALVLIPRFDLRHILLAIQKHRPKAFAGAPRIYVAVANAPDLEKYDLRSVEAFVSGSAPLPLEVQQRFERLTGGKVIEGYGLTEAAPVTHGNPRRGKRKVGSIGLPYPDIDARIVDLETGTHDLPPG